MHRWIAPFILSQARTISKPASATTLPWAPPFTATACFGKLKNSIPGGFSQGVRWLRQSKDEKGKRGLPDVSDAPAVPLRMLEGTQHLFPQDFRERGPAHPARTRLRDIRRAVTAA
jgi:hypothetical protein